MSPQPASEEVPYQHVIAELEQTLQFRTTELVMANARIRSRDERIAGLQARIDRLNSDRPQWDEIAPAQ